MTFGVMSGVGRRVGDVLDGLMIAEGKGQFCGVNVGRHTGNFVAQLCESDALFPHFFREDVIVTPQSTMEYTSVANVARCVHSSVNKPGVKRNSGS